MDKLRTIIGVDIGGTKISAGLFLDNGQMLHQEKMQIASRKGTAVIDLVAELVRSLISFASQDFREVMALGVCVPGIYHPLQKTAWAPNIPDWDHIPVWQELTNRISQPSLQIVIESDRSCYILGELWKGRALNCTDAIFLAVGTGIGAGILSNGQIISGRSGIAGALGWMALEPPYDRKYDAWGNFEHFASGNGLARSAIEMLQSQHTPASILDQLPTDKVSAREIFSAFEQGDPVAISVLDKAIQYWGMATANLISIFNPQKIIFGGGVFGPATQFLHRIEEEASKWAQPISMEEVALEVSVLEGNAGLIGAAYLAIKAVQEDHHEP